MIKRVLVVVILDQQDQVIERITFDINKYIPSLQTPLLSPPPFKIQAKIEDWEVEATE